MPFYAPAYYPVARPGTCKIAQLPHQSLMQTGAGGGGGGAYSSWNAPQSLFSSPRWTADDSPHTILQSTMETTIQFKPYNISFKKKRVHGWSGSCPHSRPHGPVCKPLIQSALTTRTQSMLERSIGMLKATGVPFPDYIPPLEEMPDDPLDAPHGDSIMVWQQLVYCLWGLEHMVLYTCGSVKPFETVDSGIGL